MACRREDNLLSWRTVAEGDEPFRIGGPLQHLADYTVVALIIARYALTTSARLGQARVASWFGTEHGLP